MSYRVIELAEEAAELSIRHAQLVIERLERPEVTAPLSEVAVLMLTHPRIHLTRSVISGLAECGGMVVVCDDNYLPSAMLLPLRANSLQTERYAAQARITEPLRKRLWRQIVRAKIRAQGQVLVELFGPGNDGGLLTMANRVKSGDAGNLEAQAARRYWPLLFADSRFHRGAEGPDQNNHLNYGYATLRSLVARAICGAGLHPSFGLEHSNRYNAFCLADDLMEPFRPLVDINVARWVLNPLNNPGEPLGKAQKQYLIEVVLRPYPVQFRSDETKEFRTLFEVMSRTAASLTRAIMGEQREMEIPTLDLTLGGNG